jgi:hypothetical protein
MLFVIDKAADHTHPSFVFHESKKNHHDSNVV